MASRLRGALLTATLVAALATALVGTAGAAGFVADETLTSTAANVPALAMAPNGYAIVAWVERPAAVPVVLVSVRPPGGAWTAPQTLPVGMPSANDLDVAIVSSGAAAISWQEVTSPSTFRVAIATRTPDGTFGAPELLTDGRQTLYPSIGIDASGDVTLLYNPSPDVSVRDFPVGTSVLAAPPQPIATRCSAFVRQFAVAPSGDAVAAFVCGGAVFALRRGGVWSVSPQIADTIGSSCPSPSTSIFRRPASAAIDTAGRVVGVLQTEVRQPDFSCLGFGGSTSIDARLVLPLGGLMTPVGGDPIASGSSFGFFGFTPVVAPQAEISSDGIVASWGESTGTASAHAKARFYAVDGSGASAPQTVGATPSVGQVAPSLAVAADGRALLAWLQLDRPGAEVVLLVAERPPGGTFGEPAPLDGAGGAASGEVAMAETGDGLAAWIAGASAPYALHARGFDASAPTLSGVAIPPTAIAGVPASFAASAFDLWGPATIRWDFGDGATAAGATAQHTYAAPGRYAASVVATDAVGLAAPAQTGTVQVAAAPTGGAVGPPALSGASVRPATFRVGRAATAVSAARRRGASGRPRRRPPVGTTFRFTLDRAATVTIAFARQAPGKRSGGRCVRPARRLARARRCTRFVPSGQLVRRVSAGANVVPFSGRVGRRALAPGRYGARLTAAVDGRASAESTLFFRVVR